MRRNQCNGVRTKGKNQYKNKNEAPYSPISQPRKHQSTATTAVFSTITRSYPDISRFLHSKELSRQSSPWPPESLSGGCGGCVLLVHTRKSRRLERGIGTSALSFRNFSQYTIFERTASSCGPNITTEEEYELSSSREGHNRSATRGEHPSSPWLYRCSSTFAVTVDREVVRKGQNTGVKLRKCRNSFLKNVSDLI